MRKKEIAAVMLSVMMSLGLTAPTYAQEITVSQEKTEVQEKDLLTGISKENYPRVDGSTATLPLSTAVYSLITGCSQAEADETIVHSKTTNSWLNLIDGNVDLLIVADKNEKVDQAISEKQVELEYKPIGLDAFVFMVNEDNPVQSLTDEQIVGIYSGSIKNWSEVGGENIEVIPFQRNENAGSQTAMKNLVMKGVPMVDPQMLEIPTMMGLLESVASYNNAANAIGYSYFYYTDLMCQIPGLRYIAVNGIEPAVETIQSGEYPYIAQYYAAIRKDEPQDSPARRIYEWLTSASAQELAADLGYVPLDASIQVEKPHYESYAEAGLPIGEDECFILCPGDNTVMVLDQSGNTIHQFENAEICGQSALAMGKKAGIWKKTEPLPVRVKTGKQDSDGMDYKAGLFSLEQGEWILEPAYYDMKKVSDNLYSEVGLDNAGTRLFTMDGIVLNDSANFYLSTENYIYGYNEVRDREGNLIFSLDEGYIETIRENPETGLPEILVWEYEPEYRAVLYDAAGNLLWEQDPEISIRLAENGSITWCVNQEENLITDWKLDTVLSEESFLNQNKSIGVYGESLVLYQQDPLSGKLLVGFEGADSDQMLYVCDAAGKVLESYSRNACAFADSFRNDRCDALFVPNSSTSCWVYEQNAAGNICFRDVFGYHQIDTDVSWYPSSYVYITVNADIIQATIYDEAEKETSMFFTAEGKMFAKYSCWATGSVTDHDIFMIEGCEDEQQEYRTHFYTVDGQLILENTEGNAWYAAPELRCVQYGSYCYLENDQGKLYRRILCQDEEKDDEAIENDFFLN